MYKKINSARLIIEDPAFSYFNAQKRQFLTAKATFTRQVTKRHVYHPKVCETDVGFKLIPVIKHIAKHL
jgi:hypothetical protein